MEYYHGTNISFKPPFKNKITWLVKSYQYALNHASISSDTKALVLRCSIRENLNLFDPRNSKHVEILRMLLPKNLSLPIYGLPEENISKSFFVRQLELMTNDVWRFLECPTILTILKTKFDGHISKEDNELTYCIYNPANIKIEKYIEEMNRSEYDDCY